MHIRQIYRASDLLVRNRDTIEESLFRRIHNLFSLPATVILYDLTNTYFEVEVYGNAKAKRGHSRENRNDCPLVALGLVLDGSGFVRRSLVFEGNVAEAYTLERMFTGLTLPRAPWGWSCRGIATETNIQWLIEHNFRYLVVSRLPV